MPIDHFANPCNIGALENPDAVGQSGAPGQGPYMTIYLKGANGTISEARFETYGCPTARACGSWVTVWAVGKPSESLGLIEPGDLIRVLGGVPLGKEHCADLAVTALRNAALELTSEPRTQL